MATVSDEEVQAAIEDVEKLREQLAAAEAKRLDNERSQSNAIQLAQLNAEKERLTLEVQRAQEAAKVGNVREGASAPIEAAKDSMTAAVAAQKEEQKLAKADAKASTPASATTTGEGS